MATSPTARTLTECRKRGWPCQVVEKWIPMVKRRVDLFGCIDLIAVVPASPHNESYILGIQATSDPNVASRVTKAKAEPKLRDWMLAGGRFAVWGWGKKGPAGKRKLWTLREHWLTLADLEVPDESAAS